MLGLPATCFLLFLSCISTIFAQQDAVPIPHDDGTSAANNATKLICRPFGNCEPCPDNALHEPFCQPFGNRRLMHCVPASSNSSSDSTSTSSSSSNSHTSISRDFSNSNPQQRQNHPPPPLQRQQSPSSSSSPPPSSNKSPSSSKDPPETPAWESCGRLPAIERADFTEFVLCNLVFCVLALCMVGVRGRKMRVMQARMLAARIGLVRGGGGGR